MHSHPPKPLGKYDVASAERRFVAQQVHGGDADLQVLAAASVHCSTFD
jgi:hypothetical protein